MRSLARLGALPIPLLALFGAFLLAMGYLVAASITRRTAPVYAASPADRTRSAGWERGGDTLTIDASDGERWQYVSLAHGRVLVPPDTAGWELAVQRYRVRSLGSIIDLGERAFESAARRGADASGGAPAAADLGHWYRYNMLTHLLEPNGHVYLVRPAGTAGPSWKVAVLSYYCPGLTAGCLTIRYVPLP